MIIKRLHTKKWSLMGYGSCGTLQVLVHIKSTDSTTQVHTAEYYEQYLLKYEAGSNLVLIWCNVEKLR